MINLSAVPRTDKYKKYKHNEKEQEKEEDRNNMCLCSLLCVAYILITYTHAIYEIN